MSGEPISTVADYLNPVYPHSFPDPFVLKHAGEYYAYSTGLHPDGGVFPMLCSRDLVHWSDAGAAMKRLETDAPFYWAPEVVFADGKFYLYYSVGNEAQMELRVAVSDRPNGGFVDSGNRLTAEEFAIDAHVFTDDDGSRYMFYATDFLDHTHIGTGTVVDRMIDLFTLAGEPRPVTRAKYDWQVYDPERKEKGGVRWHTVEGPAVFKRKNSYFEMFSGGNWQNTTYGVSFAVTDSLATPREWHQFSDGHTVLPILRTIPGVIVGPGHNSVVRGPNNRELYCVYHRWTDAGRVLAIDRMDVAGERIFVLGATDTPQPMPFMPALADNLGDQKATWAVPDSWLCELTLTLPANGQVSLSVDEGQLTISDKRTDRPGHITTFEMTSGAHLVRIETDNRWLRVTVDAWQEVFSGWLDSVATSFTIDLENSTHISGLAVTEGFEDLFDRSPSSFDTSGWLVSPSAEARISEGEMMVTAGEREVRVSRRQSFRALDFAVNIRAQAEAETEFAIQLCDTGDNALASLKAGEWLEIEIAGSLILLEWPVNWNIGGYHQYRLLALAGSVTVYLENHKLGTFPLPATDLRPAVCCRSGTISMEMVRATGV